MNTEIMDEKRIVSYDELVFGLLLKFGSVDVSDITVAMMMLGIDNFSSVNESGLGKYIRKNDDGRFEFDEGTIRRNYECVDEFYLVVENFLGSIVKEYFDNLDLFEFVLKKIKMLGNVSVESYKNNFSNMQMFVVNELKNRRYLLDYWHDLNDDCKNTKLTVRGELYLFLIDNRELIEKFSKELRDSGYNDLLLDSFLIAQKLDGDVKYIKETLLTVDSFLEFCDIYGINPNIIDSNKKDDNKGHCRRRNLSNGSCF